MKKLFISLLMAIGLCGLAMAQDPLSDYVIGSENVSFLDLEDETLMGMNIPLGSELLAEENTPTSLTNYYYHFNPMAGEEASPFSATNITEAKALTAFDLALLQITGSHNFMGKPFKSFIISALGGIYFSDAASDLESGSLASITAPLYSTPFDQTTGDCILLLAYDKNNNLIVPTLGQTLPANLYLDMQDDGTVNFLTQFDYMLGDQNWKFQISWKDDGSIAFAAKTMAGTADNEYSVYLAIRRGSETMLISAENAEGTLTPKAITAASEAIKINANTTFNNFAFAATGPESSFAISDVSYASAKATAKLDAADKARLSQANTSLVVLLSTNSQATPGTMDKEYQVGQWLGNRLYRVVYSAKPADLDNLQFVCQRMSPGSIYYLHAYIATKVTNDVTETTEWLYDEKPVFSSENIRTTALTGPTGIAAGTVTNGKLPLTITTNPDFATMLVKTNDFDALDPRGSLEVGSTCVRYSANSDKDEIIATGTVLTFLPKGTTTYNLEMQPGEMTYIQAFAVANEQTDNAAYSADGGNPTAAVLPAYRQAEKLPVSYTFSQHDYAELIEANTLPLLPPGLSTSAVLPEDNEEEALKIRSSAFHMEIDPFKNTALLLSRYYGEFVGKDDDYNPIFAMDTRWVDVIFPAFSGAENVLANIQMQFVEDGRPVGFNITKPNEGDSICIEYSLNGGDWQRLQLYTIANLPPAEGGVYTLDHEFKCQKDDVVRVRYSYRSNTYSTKNALLAYEFLEGRDCAKPVNLQLVADGTTDKEIKLSWSDPNVVPAGQYLVSYQKYVAPASDGDMGDGGTAFMAAEEGTPEEGGAEETDVWQTLSVNTAEAVLRNLEGHTAYSIKVQAVCGAEDFSYTTTPATFSTFYGLPYHEPMVMGYSSMDVWDYDILPDVTTYTGSLDNMAAWTKTDFVNGYSGWIGDNSQAANIDYEDPDALAVATDTKYATIVLSPIYIRKTGGFYPKTLTFKANPYERQVDETTYQTTIINGAELDAETKLHVLASADGKFTAQNIVKTFTAQDLKIAAEEGKETPRGQELLVKLDNYEGPVTLAFYFDNPNFLDYDAEDYNGEMPLYLELFDVNFDYNETPCFPVEDLKAEAELAEATLTWVGEGAEYGISYGPASAEGYDTTIYRMATETEVQTLKLTGLTSNTEYKVAVVSYCTAGDREHGSIARTTTFTTLRQMYTVAVNITPEGAGTVTGANSYLEGTNATLTATANPGYKFVAWMDGEKELSTEASYKFQVTANVTYTAKFEELPTYTLTLTASPAEGGQVEGADKYHVGDTVTVKATANEGYRFVAWKNGETELSKDASYTFLMPAQDVTYTAVFVKGTANEALLQASFTVGTQDGQLYVRNLNGITVKDINVYGLTGNLINRFAPNSREDLMLPIDAQRAILFVRLNTEKGVAVYKVYLQ